MNAAPEAFGNGIFLMEVKISVGQPASATKTKTLAFGRRQRCIAGHTEIGIKKVQDRLPPVVDGFKQGIRHGKKITGD